MTMLFTRTWQNSVTTPVPSDVDPGKVTGILHDHGFLITMSPIVTRYERADGDGVNPDLNKKITYHVWENIDFVPGGLLRREISFKCRFQNTDNGVVSWLEAPLGLTSQATYSVTFVDGTEGGWVLEEHIESSCNVLLKSFVESTMVSTRKEMHQRIINRASETGP